eukprot:tig00000113_g5594.t1
MLPLSRFQRHGQRKQRGRGHDAPEDLHRAQISPNSTPSGSSGEGKNGTTLASHAAAFVRLAMWSRSPASGLHGDVLEAMNLREGAKEKRHASSVPKNAEYEQGFGAADAFLEKDLLLAVGDSHEERDDVTALPHRPRMYSIDLGTERGIEPSSPPVQRPARKLKDEFVKRPSFALLGSSAPLDSILALYKRYIETKHGKNENLRTDLFRLDEEGTSTSLRDISSLEEEEEAEEAPTLADAVFSQACAKGSLRATSAPVAIPAPRFSDN